MSPQQILVTAAAVMFCVIGGLFMVSHIYTLSSIKSRTVGDGQHGTAHWASGQEIKATYQHVLFDVENWRQGKNLPNQQGLVVGCVGKPTKITALVDTGDVHCLMIGAAGVGKTAFFLYPNLEYACASGMSFLTTDTKGDLHRNYAGIAKDCYGYQVAVLDLRNPTHSDGNNLLHLVNRYMDVWHKDNTDVGARAKAEKYAKIISKSIISAGGDNAAMGQNAYFYDSAEGLLTAAILLIAEYVQPVKVNGKTVDKRHIVSVYKLVQDLLEGQPTRMDGRVYSQFQLLMEMLPKNHKARWFAGAALNTSEQAMASVLSTVLSRLNAFLDTELESIICFDSEMDAEKFCTQKSAIFIVLPEEDETKYFMVSLFLQQFYREMLTVADSHGGKLPNRVVLYADEIGTIPKIESFELMLSAGRSRRISVVPIIQSLAQLQKNYGAEGSEIVVDNCQLTLFGGFAPNSQTAGTLSQSLGNRTVLSGSVNRGKNDPSQTLQMMERPLMTADELKAIPKGQFVVTKTGSNPMRTRLRLFTQWGITMDHPFEVPKNAGRKVHYATKEEVQEGIARQMCAESPEEEQDEPYTGKGQGGITGPAQAMQSGKKKSGGPAMAKTPQQKMSSFRQKQQEPPFIGHERRE